LSRPGLWAPVVAYMAAIFYVSSLSDVSIPGGAPDSAAHFLEYLGLSILVVRAVVGGLPRRIGLRVAALAVLITAAYGATDEVHQLLVPGRTAAWNDLIADIIGAIAGAAACGAWGILAVDSEPSRSASRDEF
jgi:hypothetical protein